MGRDSVTSRGQTTLGNRICGHPFVNWQEPGISRRIASVARGRLERLALVDSRAIDIGIDAAVDHGG